MVLSRKELGAILLALGAIVFYLILLSATPSGAQTGGLTTNSTIITNPTPNNRGGVTAIANPPRREKSVINIPRKPLPPSGGLPVYGVVASSVLAGAGLLTLGVLIRRGSRR